jgi:hypothetical protein
VVSFLYFDKTAGFTEVEDDDDVDLLDSYYQPSSRILTTNHQVMRNWQN